MAYLTIFIIALSTFIVMDINNPNFEATHTAKYLDLIGAKSYVNDSVIYIKNSKFFQQYILTNWNSLIKFLRPYSLSLKREAKQYTSLVVNYVQKHSVKFVNYFETTAIPTLKTYTSKYSVVVQKYAKAFYASASEFTLVAGDWLSQNIYQKLPHEKIEKMFFDFVATTQKVSNNYYDWLSNQVQKFIV